MNTDLEQKKFSYPLNCPESLGKTMRFQLIAESALRYLLGSRDENGAFSGGVILERTCLDSLYQSIFKYPLLELMLRSERESYFLNQQNDFESSSEAKGWGALPDDFGDLLEADSEDEGFGAGTLEDLKAQHYPNIEAIVLAAAVDSWGGYKLFVVFKNLQDGSLILPAAHIDWGIDLKSEVLSSKDLLIGKIIEIPSPSQAGESFEVSMCSDFLCEQAWKDQIQMLANGQVTPWLNASLKEQCSMQSVMSEGFSVISVSHSREDNSAEFSALLRVELVQNSLNRIPVLLVKFKQDLYENDPCFYLDDAVFFSSEAESIKRFLLGYPGIVEGEDRGQDIPKAEKLSQGEKAELEEFAENLISDQESQELLLEKLKFAKLSENPEISESVSRLIDACEGNWIASHLREGDAESDDASLKTEKTFFSPVSVDDTSLIVVFSCVSKDIGSQALLVNFDIEGPSESYPKELGLHLSKQGYFDLVSNVLAGNLDSAFAKNVFMLALGLSEDEFYEGLESLRQQYEIILGFCPLQPKSESSRRIHFLLLNQQTRDKIVLSFTYDEDACFLPFVDKGSFEGMRIESIHYGPNAKLA